MSVQESVISACFKNIISIRGNCTDVVSTSGLYSNDIDITPDFIDEVRNRSYLTTIDFFNKKLDFAITNVADQAIAAMSKKFKVTSLIEDARLGHFNDNFKMIAGNGKLKGINIDLCNSDSFLNLFISEISLQVNYTGDVNVLVYDLIQNKLIDTITIATVANEVSSFYVAKEYFSAKKKLNLLFVYDSTGIDSNTTYLNGANCRNCGDKPKGIHNSFEFVNGASIAAAAQKIKSNLSLSSETGGMSIVHSISCNHKQWLCTFSNMLALPILYRFGELVMEYALMVSPNDRLNTTNTLNAEELEKRRLFNQAKFEETFASVMSNVKTPNDTRCYECSEGVRHVISTL